MPNNVNAYIPDWWANETLAILEENMVIAGAIHRDFEPMFQQYGDIVNTRRPNEFVAIRKGKGAITTQDAIATNVAVPLDQHIHVSFSIDDVDETTSMKRLIDEYINPAALALARQADRTLLGQAARFMEAGRIVGTKANSPYDNIVDGDTYLTQSNCYEAGRNIILSPQFNGQLRKNVNLFPVDKWGGDQIVKGGMIEMLSNFRLWKAQNVMNVELVSNGTTVGTTSTSATVRSLKGSSTVTLAANSGLAVAANQTIIVNGSPYFVQSVAAGPPIVVTLTTPLREDVPINSTIYNTTRARSGATGYTAGHILGVEFATGAGIYQPQVGCIVIIAGKYYTVVNPVPGAANTFQLDRPLEDALAANTDVFVIAGVACNFAFHRNALTAAIRPLAPTPAGMGVVSSTKNYKGFSIRATLGYNMNLQQNMCTLDFLMGTKVLDNNLACVVVG